MNTELIFVLLVVSLLRILYYLVDLIVKVSKTEWNEIKRRQFVVRIISLTHAATSGMSTLYGCYYYNELWSNPYLYNCQYGRYVLLFSMSYFIHDCIDMLVHGEGRRYKEYVIHHMLSIIGVTSILLSNRLLGLGVVCLLVEVQTTFLHIRTILRILGFSRKKSILYRIIMHLNLGGLILFRHAPTLYLLFYVCFTEHRAHAILRFLLACALAFLTYHNCHLQYRFMRMDGYIETATSSDEDLIIDPLDKCPKKIDEKSS